MTHRAMVARRVRAENRPCLVHPQWNPSRPCSGGLGPYLVEVGGPVLSLLGLSFICVLFVCFVLHSHTALANLPNEPQELHNDNNGNRQTTHIRMVDRFPAPKVGSSETPRLVFTLCSSSVFTLLLIHM